MKKLIIPILLLSACKPEVSLKHDESIKQTPCYDVINVTSGQPTGPILINKCTGETWMALKITEEKKKDELFPGYTLTWYKIGMSYVLNTVAGIKK